MNDILRIRSIDVASHSMDDSNPPNYGAATVCVGGTDVRVFLSKEQVGRLVAAAEPIIMEQLRTVSSIMNTGAAG